jgi:hypothetical protein
MLVQPSGNLICSELVVDFGDDERPLSGEKSCGASEDFVLTTLHVYLDHLRRRSPGCDEVVQCDCRNIYDFTLCQHGTVPVGFNATLGPGCCAATKGESIAGGTRPYSGMHDLKATVQSVPHSIVPQAFDILGISFKSHNLTQFAYKLGGAESHGAHVGANVIDNGTGPNPSQNCILHFGFVLSTPEARFSGNTNLHPQSLG